MADITMCSWEWCPMRDRCYRYKAKRDIHQLMFVDVPINDGKCEYLWERQDNMIDTDNDLL